jgi:hypothetical protein
MYCLQCLFFHPFFYLAFIEPNCRPIYSIILGEVEIERHGTKVENLEEFVGFFDL